MTALTTARLDELERRAKGALDEEKWQGVSAAAGTWFEDEHIADALAEFFEESPRQLLEAEAAHIAANSPDVTLHLVAIARAALAWRAQITTLSLAAGLPQQVWAELCRLDSEMAAVLRGEP